MAEYEQLNSELDSFDDDDDDDVDDEQKDKYLTFHLGKCR